MLAFTLLIMHFILHMAIGGAVCLAVKMFEIYCLLIMLNKWGR